MAAAYEWHPIEDLPPDWHRLVPTELDSLAEIWQDQVVRLQETAALRQFNDRLRRQWAIETGVIEGLYTIDIGTTQLLIEHGIEADLIPHGATDRPVEQVLPVLLDQEAVLEGLFDFVAQRRPLSTSYIKEIHAALTRHQDHVEAVDVFGNRVRAPLLRGEWKRLPNNPTRPDGAIHEYSPPEQVASEMDRLVELHHEHARAGGSPVVEAAWLHHAFTQIHPFQDGNGRVARTLASLVFLRAGWFPLVVERGARVSYIQALEAADAGDLAPLVDLFAGIERRAFVTALSLSESVLRDHEAIDQVIAAAGERLKVRYEAQTEERRRAYEAVFTLAQRLEGLSLEALQHAAQGLHTGMQAVNPSYFAVADRSTADTEHWFRHQIAETARALHYYADTRSFRAWVRLQIKEDRQADLVVAFHALGVEFLGIMAASAFLEFRDRTEDGGTSIEGPFVLSRDVFQFAYNEAEDSVVNRFREWLDEAILAGLEQWRRQL